MNWIITWSNSEKTKRLRYPTDLGRILLPIFEELIDFNWLVSDIEITFMENLDLPMNYEKACFILPKEEFIKILNSDLQVIWGVFIAIPTKFDIKTGETEIPYSEGKDEIWEENQFQHTNAQIEIICFDGSYTIIKFRDKPLSYKFIASCPEAISLGKFNIKNSHA